MVLENEDLTERIIGAAIEVHWRRFLKLFLVSCIPH